MAATRSGNLIGEMTVYDFHAKTIDGREIPLSSYKGKVLLIVNVASRCGFTPQYGGLQKLYDQHRASGFEVLGFPCNQFGQQEPAKESEIQTFCDLNYGVKFPLFSKIDVNGPGAHPVFEFLKREKPGLLGWKRIKWNFTKFLIDRTGKPIKRYSPQTKPGVIEKDIEAALK
jgi:glutathione peroxidase